MALVGNGVRLSASNPMRQLGAASAGSINRASWAMPGALRNFYAGEATVVAGASIADTAAFPNGYEPPYSWVMAPKGGGLGAYSYVTGDGEINVANLLMGRNCDATLTGSGTISSAASALIVQAAATLLGSGTITSAPLVGTVQMVAALAGSGAITSALQLLAGLTAALTGAGAASGNLRGTLGMDAEISSEGELVTAASCAAAVWNALAAEFDNIGSFGELVASVPSFDAADGIETGLTFREAIRLITAALAGKISGGAGTTITIRNAVADDTDRIVATVDDDGNRTAITYDLD